MDGVAVIAAEELAGRLAGLDDIGRTEHGYQRLAWTEADAAAGVWFERQAAELSLRCVRDRAGNRWALPRSGSGPWWAVGSHLDTVAGGGRYDGALGVAAGFAVAAAIPVAVAVVAFADEEGARFNTPTFGSRALTGALDVADVLGRRDNDGIELAAAMRAAGVDPDGLAAAAGDLDHLAGIIELHIDQTRELAVAEVPVGVVTGLAARLRLAIELRGAADHAGTTPTDERRDALAAAAHAIVAAERIGGGYERMVTTAARILAYPNALTTVPEHVQLWLDARAPDPDAVVSFERELTAELERLGGERRVQIGIKRAAFNVGTSFDPVVRSVMRDAASERAIAAIELPCMAGHDAGVIAALRPAGMIFVRNATGVSHSPAEHVEIDDAAQAATVMAAAVAALAADGGQ